MVVGAKNTLSIIGVFSELIFDYRTKIKVKIESRSTGTPKIEKSANIGEAQVGPARRMKRTPLSTHGVMHALCMFIAKDMRPLHLVEGAGFRAFVKALDPGST